MRQLLDTAWAAEDVETDEFENGTVLGDLRGLAFGGQHNLNLRGAVLDIFD